MVEHLRYPGLKPARAQTAAEPVRPASTRRRP
jgi:hypothetical protein